MLISMTLDSSYVSPMVSGRGIHPPTAYRSPGIGGAPRPPSQDRDEKCYDPPGLAYRGCGCWVPISLPASHQFSMEWRTLHHHISSPPSALQARYRALSPAVLSRFRIPRMESRILSLHCPWYRDWKVLRLHPSLSQGRGTPPPIPVVSNFLLNQRTPSLHPPQG